MRSSANMFAFMVPICVLLMSCGNKVAEGTPDFEFVGEIAPESVADAVKQIRTYDDREIRLSIRSTGGDALAAMEIGDAIFRHGRVTLIVDRYCHSACAQYIMPSAARLDIRSNVSIIFHNSPVARILPTDAPADAAEAYALFAERERNFYDERKIDYDRLRAVQSFVMPLCYFRVNDEKVTGLGAYGTINRFGGVVPSRRLVESIGYKITDGYWPANGYVALSDARSAGLSSKLSFSFVDGHRLTSAIASTKRQYRHLPICAPSLLKAAGEEN